MILLLSINNFEENAGATTINMALMKGVTTVGLSSSKDTGDTVLTNVDTLDTVQYKQGAGDLTVTYGTTVVAGAADAVSIEVDGQTGIIWAISRTNCAISHHSTC